MATKTNKDLYELTAKLTIVDDTPAQVEEIWDGIWDEVLLNYLDSTSTIIKGFAQCGFNGSGKPAAKLTNEFCEQHAISEQNQPYLDNNAERPLCLIAVGDISREFTACILAQIFTALGVLCRQNSSIKIECGEVGYFIFNPTTKMYKFNFQIVSRKHPEWRDERLCEIANKKEIYDEADEMKTTDRISFKSAAKPITKATEGFELTKRPGYMGVVTAP